MTQRELQDPLKHLASLNGPTADIDQMLREIEAGRGSHELSTCSPTPSSPA